MGRWSSVKNVCCVSLRTLHPQDLCEKEKTKTPTKKQKQAQMDQWSRALAAL